MAKCILINDTHFASRRMLRFALEIKGHEILESADPVETLELLASRRIDLLMVGLYPQDDRGYAVLERLLEGPKQAACPVILVGDAVLRAEYGAQRWRGTAWLDRPFRVSELMNLTDSIFSQPAMAFNGGGST